AIATVPAVSRTVAATASQAATTRSRAIVRWPSPPKWIHPLLRPTARWREQRTGKRLVPMRTAAEAG
ncbi:hypothetical protein, partial [Streptosporangium sp. NPDC049644]|uniref:hypothetical protein n=1 Tax=Streptosporangium sp. NPDC049644 TaxID=3155507 RepID=UPI00342CC549